MPAQLCATREALSGLRSGMTVMVGGFGLVRAPLTLIEALGELEVDGLTVISNNLGEPGRGLGKLLRQGKIRRAIGSYFTSNPEVAGAKQRGELEVGLLPQGTLAEAIRAGGAGLGGFYTPTGAGTSLAEGKEQRWLGGRLQVFEQPLTADFALIRAQRADSLGNLHYRRTAQNFNPAMATAARITVAEVDELLPEGALEPEAVHTPHLYVQRLVLAEVQILDVKPASEMLA